VLTRHQLRRALQFVLLFSVVLFSLVCFFLTIKVCCASLETAADCLHGFQTSKLGSVSRAGDGISGSRELPGSEWGGAPI
jgi:hypothetical protein